MDALKNITLNIVALPLYVIFHAAVVFFMHKLAIQFASTNINISFGIAIICFVEIIATCKGINYRVRNLSKI